MADIQNINSIINVKRRQIAEILHSNRKSGSANRTVVSKFTPEVHKLPFLRMRSTNVAKMAVAGNAGCCVGSPD